MSNATQPSRVHSPLLLDLDNHLVDPRKSEDALVKVFIFTRTDCPIANRYAPEIRRLSGQYMPGSVAFALVYVDPNESSEAIRRHMREYSYPCPGLRDPDHAFVELCGATVTPECVVFSQSGAMVYRGRIDDRYVELGRARPEPTCHDLADAIEATIHGRPVVNSRTKAIGCLIADLLRRSGN